VISKISIPASNESWKTLRSRWVLMESDIGLFFGGTKVVKKVRGRWGDLSDFSDGAKGRVGDGAT
jgi:hypothetical protein